MADTYEQTLEQKASLTKSDYIRIVGSDNASYKQTINDVMTTMGVNPYHYTDNSGSFLDWVKATFTANGEYYVLVATNNYTDWCTNALGTCIVQKRNSDWYLIAMPNDTAVANNQSIYINKTNGNNWVGWTKLPTRSEIDSKITWGGSRKIADFQNTSANTWEYIGYSLTVPSGHVYLLTFYTGWASGQPSGLGINKGSQTFVQAPSYVKEGNVIFQTGTVTLLGGNTYYFFSKRANVPSSTNSFSIYYLDVVV